MATLVSWFLDALPAIVAFASLIVAISLALAASRARRAGWRAALGSTMPDAMLLVALGAIAVLTLGDPMGPQPDRFNLVPFRDQWWALQGVVDPALAAATLVGNVLLFVPLGAALAARHLEVGAGRLVLWAAAISVAVEAAQGLMNVGRLADITDVMANTAGAAVGVALWGAVVGGKSSKDERSV
ncbi:MAG TPA: VanZ family protein [Candidatus Limnocylindria bacterium]